MGTQGKLAEVTERVVALLEELPQEEAGRILLSAAVLLGVDLSLGDSNRVSVRKPAKKPGKKPAKKFAKKPAPKFRK